MATACNLFETLEQWLRMMWFDDIRAETITRVTQIIRLQKNGQSKISASRLRLIPVTRIM